MHGTNMKIVNVRLFVILKMIVLLQYYNINMWMWLPVQTVHVL